VDGDEIEGAAVVDLLVRTGLAKSKGDARRTIEQGGVSMAGEPVADVAATVGSGDLAAGRYLLLRRGKSTYHLLRVRG
jgi:tyrosyl-tRNA synthetase